MKQQKASKNLKTKKQSNIILFMYFNQIYYYQTKYCFKVDVQVLSKYKCSILKYNTNQYVVQRHTGQYVFL